MTGQDAVDFGETRVTAADSGGGLMDGVRGVTPGSGPPQDSGQAIEFININTTSDGIDFGELSAPRDMPQSAGDGNRGVSIAGYSATPPAAYGDHMDYITIGMNGNAIDFGESHQVRGRTSGHCSDGNRGMYTGGQNPGAIDTMGYITIPTLSNGIDFGELTDARGYSCHVSSGYRGVHIAGHDGGGAVNVIDYWHIGVVGSAMDFGDHVVATYASPSISGG